MYYGILDWCVVEFVQKPIISKGIFEIPHKMTYTYIERYVFYSGVKIQELLDLRAHENFGNDSAGLIFCMYFHCYGFP